MNAVTPEAIERRKARDRAKSKKKKQAKRVERVRALVPSPLPIHKITARRMLPRLPNMTKSELREMLAQAIINTGGN